MLISLPWTNNGCNDFSLNSICFPWYIIHIIAHIFLCTEQWITRLFHAFIKYILKMVHFRLHFKFPICDPLKPCSVHIKTGLHLSMDYFQFMIKFSWEFLRLSWFHSLLNLTRHSISRDHRESYRTISKTYIFLTFKVYILL